MVFKIVEIHNVEELINNEDGSISWIRVPSCVCEHLDSAQGKRVAGNSTGVELRFVLKGERAVIRMCTREGDGIFHVYRGGIQGGWQDHEMHKLVRTCAEDYVIEKSSNSERLKVMTEKCGYSWDSEVIRIVFDRGFFKIFDIDGDVMPPQRDQCPEKVLLCYGSSITHGSNAIDASHTWASILGHNLNMDVKNLGMAGSCAMEAEMIDYIASEGEKGHWDIALLELGINVLDWEEEKILSRVENTIRQIAGRNADKKVLVISPFYYCGDDFEENGYADRWRRIICQVVKELNYENVTYINGLEVLGDMSYMSADEIHPNIYGVQKIADSMTARIKELC